MRADAWHARHMADLESLSAAIRQFNAERDWGALHDPKSLLLALTGEVGELAEQFQWIPADQSLDKARGELNGQVADELADIFSYLIALAHACEVDLAEAVEAKLKLNAARYPVSQFKGKAPEHAQPGLALTANAGRSGILATESTRTDNIGGHDFVIWQTAGLDSLDDKLDPERKHPGIYILRFANNERLVGQSPNMIAEYPRLQRIWDDIIELAYVESDEDRQAATAGVSKEVAATFPMRDTSSTVPRQIRADLSAIITPQSLFDWRAGEDVRVPRRDDQRRRLARRPDFDQLCGYGAYPQIVTAIKHYVSQCISHPRQTEAALWSVSSMPQAQRSRYTRRLVEVCCGPGQTLVIIETGRAGQGMIEGYLHVDLPAVYRNLHLPPRIQSLGGRMEKAAMEPFGVVGKAWFGSLDILLALLDDPLVVTRARTLNSVLMYSGSTDHRSEHDFNLADEILGV